MHPVSHTHKHTSLHPVLCEGESRKACDGVLWLTSQLQSNHIQNDLIEFTCDLRRNSRSVSLSLCLKAVLNIWFSQSKERIRIKYCKLDLKLFVNTKQEVIFGPMQTYALVMTEIYFIPPACVCALVYLCQWVCTR